ncbi:MAG: PadR family transcriptional regulator [Geminicoccaceae bacterium]|nr:PadR family transcriptional regulator [Geminicoccaceae bacterium]
MDTKLLCLGVLSEGERSGYEIKKLFETRFRHFFVAGFGSIYPALAALAGEGYVTARAVPQAGRPDKRVYSVTEAGLDHFRERLLATAPRHKVRSEFCLLMYFAHLLPPERALAHLDTMVARWEEMLAGDLGLSAADEAALTPGQLFDLGFGRAVVGAARAYCLERRAPLAAALLDRPRAAE